MRKTTRLALLPGLVVLAVHGGALAGAGDEVVHHVPRAGAAIVIDGVLDEPAWEAALAVGLDYEVEPGENVAPPVKTTCFITYDDRHLYVAFRADDPDPSKIRARYSDRDRAFNDDWVGIVLDTFNDQRRAYELFSNALGVQIDALNDDVTHDYDTSWNAIWKSKARITDTGYEVEMAIPFNQIRFQKVNGEQIWGFDLNRSWPRDYRHHIGAFPRDRASNTYLGQALKLKGMEDVDPGRNLEVIPTVTGSRTDNREAFPDGRMESGSVDGDVGVSVRWGVTPNISLNGAANPDFSQVEADVLQLDVNEQFSLFYKETRPFFLEGADYFNSDLNLVHTRTIADPAAAAKLTGKTGRHTWGLFVARDEVTNLIVPGVEGSSSGSFDNSNTSSVGRYRLDFGSNSTVGATVTDRRGGGYSNSVVSADTVYRITENDTIEASFAASDTEYGGRMATELGVERGSFRDEALNLEYTHKERGWWAEVEYDDFGDGYRSDLGFRPRVGFRSLWAGGAKIWWGEPGDAFQRSALGASVRRTERQDGSLQERSFDTWANTKGPLQSEIYGGLTLSDQFFDREKFDVWNLWTGFFVQATRDMAFALDANGGDWIDFANVRPGERVYVQPSFRYTFGRHLWVHFTHIYSTLDVEGGRLFEVQAPELRVIHQFDTRAFVRLVLQYTDIERDPALYDDEVDEETRTLLSQLLFSYKINPQTALYVGYTDNQLGTEEFGLTRTDRTFFMKIGYAWLI